MSSPNDTSSDARRTNIMDLPTELRLQIFEQLFPRRMVADMRPQFLISNGVWDIRSHTRRPSDRPPRYTPILATNTSIYNELSHELYSTSGVEVPFTITDQESSPDGIFIGEISQVHFWPHIGRLRLTVSLRRKGNGELVKSRINQMICALRGENNLAELHIRIDWREFEPMPRHFNEVIRTLEGFHMSPERGQKRVVVVIVGDMDDDEKGPIKQRLEDRIRWNLNEAENLEEFIDDL